MKLTFNRICGAIVLLSCIGGFYFTPPPMPGESALHYILTDPPLFSMQVLCAAVFSFTSVIWFIGSSDV